MTLTILPGKLWPKAGAVIKCDNGHDVAIVAADPKDGSDVMGWDMSQDGNDLPDIRLMNGTPILGMMLPIRCGHCGCAAIDWDRDEAERAKSS